MVIGQKHGNGDTMLENQVYPAYHVAFTVKLFHGHSRPWDIRPPWEIASVFVCV